MTTTDYSELDAIIALAQDDLRGARKAMRRLAPTLPDTASVQTGLGLAYMALEQPRDAVRAFKRAIELDPENPLPHYHLGTHQTDQGLLPHGEVNLRIAAAVEPENAEYQAALGFNYYKADKRPEATATLEAAAAAGSEDDDVFASLGYLYYFDQRLEEGRDAFARTLELNPDYAEVYNNRGYLNILLGDFEAAQADLAACLEKSPDYLRASYNQALTTWLQGQHDEAKAQYEAARRLDKADAELKQHLSDFDEVAEKHPEEESLSELRVHLAVAQKASRH